MSILNSKTSLTSFAKPRERKSRTGERYIVSEAFGEVQHLAEVIRGAQNQGQDGFKIVVREYVDKKTKEDCYALELQTFQFTKKAEVAA
jgi:hypothetical protein